MMTATARSASQTNDLIDWMRKNNRAAREARFLVQLLIYSPKQRGKIFIFEVLTTTRACSRKSCILCLT